MSIGSAKHPPKDRLIAFGQGKLDPDESSRVESHLEDCRACCETLLDLQDDTFVGLVRTSQVDNTAESDLSQSSGHAPTILASKTTIANTSDAVPAELLNHPRYRVVELVGTGGMGNVYRAEHRLMNRPVAIKLINSQLVQNPQAVERFRREVQAAAKLSHPNIVTAYDAEQAGSSHFLVMEFVDGTDLASIVQQNGAMSVTQACDCVRQAADGLQHAHEKGMVHRDIKPHNLMLVGIQNVEFGMRKNVDRSTLVKILDFGLAGFATTLECGDSSPISDSQLDQPLRPENACGDESPHSKEDAATHLTALGSMMGTPDYMAPEQARDAHSADIRADIYSLGCTLWFLLTGQAPFQATSVIEKLKAHAEHSLPTLTALRSDVPEDLAKIIARMMAKNPEDRFQVPAEVATALRPFTDKQKSGFSMKRKLSSAMHPTWRMPAKIIASILLFLIASVIIYIATDTGQIEIEAVNDANIGRARIVLLKNGQESATFDLKPGNDVQTLRAGSYRVELRGAPEDVKLSVWSKRSDASDWGQPADHEKEPIVLYRSGGLLVRVTKSNFAAPATDVSDLGKFENPLNDCRITRDGVAITMSVPGTRSHNLVPRRLGGNLDAPRLVREVAGDFLVQVTVPPFEKPRPNTASHGLYSYRGAGLLVWLDGDNSLRLERAGIGEHQAGLPYLHGEWFQVGKQIADEQVMIPGEPDRAIHLQIERRGGEFLFRYSYDEIAWHDWRTVSNFNVPEKVSVGIAATNSTNTEFAPRFEKLSFTAPP